MEACVRYTLTSDDIVTAVSGRELSNHKKQQILRGMHWEVWEGLPPALPFYEVPSRGGRIGWQVEIKNFYIWMPPDTYEAMQRLTGSDPIVFLVLGERSGSSERFNPVMLADDPRNLPAAISKARTLNKEIIIGMLKRLVSLDS